MKLPYIGIHNPILSKWPRQITWPASQPPIHSCPFGDGSRFHLSHSIPNTLTGTTWHLQPLQLGNAAQTYEAYLTTSELPLDFYNHSPEPYTWHDHLQRIEIVEQEHRTHKCFSFAILENKGRKCLGCLHLAPLRPFLNQYSAPAHVLVRASENAAMVSCWLRTSFFNSINSQMFFTRVHQWINEEWQLPDHYFRVASSQSNLCHILNASPFKARFQIDLPGIPHQFTFFSA